MSEKERNILEEHLLEKYVKCTLELYNTVSDAIFMIHQNRATDAADALEKTQGDIQAVLGLASMGIAIDLTEGNGLFL